MVDVPRTLLRFFLEEAHAVQFVSGSIRFGRLEYYRSLEDARRDTTEGVSSVHFRMPDRPSIHATVVSANKHYVLATAHPGVDCQRLAESFGRYVVRIENPTQLLNRIQLAWRNHTLAMGDVSISPVEYTKDELLDPQLGLLGPPGHLTYAQKPRKHEHEREYRFVLTCRIDSTRHWDDRLLLRVPDCRDICSPPLWLPPQSCSPQPPVGNSSEVSEEMP